MMMNENRFWSLVADAKRRAGEDYEARVDELRAVLREVPLEEVLGFAQAFSERMAESYNAPLWGAAFLLNGGCSDDGFEYFRVWLISEGEENYCRALADPDSLAEFAEEEVELEEYCYVPGEVYNERTGQEQPEFERRRYPDIELKWDEDDLPGMFPRLAELVGEA